MNITLLPDYTDNKTITLPISVSEFWENFLADGAQSLWTDFWQATAPGSHDFVRSLWASSISQLPPNDCNYSECGSNLQANSFRRVEAKVPMKNSFFGGEAHIFKAHCLIEKSQTLLRYKVISRSQGTPYCDVQ